ncbi:MAG TPA: glycosyltransferase family 1 protein [Chloroflexia bacterium]|nr:glycosyltransferase family 1 protein [Chloroflexia bacterium]
MRVGINAHLLAFTSNYRQAGLSRYIYELLLKLPQADPHIKLTAFTGNGPISPDFLAGKARNLKLSQSRLPTVKATVRIAWEQAVLPFAAAGARLDLLHCPVNVRPLFSPCPAVITIHDLIFLRYPQGFHPAKRAYLSAMTGWSARHAAHIIAVSEATRKDVIELLGVRPGRVTTIHNGVGEQFKPLPQDERDRFRAQKGISGRVALYVGTLEPRKNLAMLLNAFRPLADDPAFSDVTLVLGGSKGWYYDEIFSTAERLGLTSSGRVRFLGRVPDEELPLWYNIASVFAYPSIYEGFGLPPLEAMACGTPVVVANTSSLPEVVGDAGELAAPEHVDAWGRALRSLLADREKAGEMRRRGMLQARKFSWDRAARETAQVYRQVLAGKKRRA